MYVGLKMILPQPFNNKELIKAFWINKTHASVSHNIVVAGDSRIYRGVSIAKITENTNQDLTGVNLGYSSGGFSQEYIQFITSRLKSEADAPKFLILGITPVSLTEEFAKNKSYNSYKNISALERYKYLYFDQLFSYTATYSPLELVSSKEKLKDVQNYQETYKKSGWVKSYKLKADSTHAIPSYTKTFTKYTVSNAITDNLFQELDSLQQTGINIIAFRPPTSQGIHQLEDSLSGYDEKHIKTLCQKYNIHWLELNRSDYISYDGSHLHYLSAEKLSEQIAVEINQILNIKAI